MFLGAVVKKCAGADLRGNHFPGLQPLGDAGITRRGHLKLVSLSIPPAILSDTVSALEFSSRKKIRPFVSSE